MLTNYRQWNAVATVNNGAASTALRAAPGSGKVLRLCAGVVCITTAATGGGGVVSIKDGSTVIASFPAAAVGAFSFSYGEEAGYPMTANTAINIVAESAVTNQATATVSAVGFIAG